MKQAHEMMSVKEPRRKKRNPVYHNFCKQSIYA